MKKNAGFALLIGLITFGGIYLSSGGSLGKADFSELFGTEILDAPHLSGYTHEDDTPINEGGNGFATADECGFIYGISETYRSFTMNFTNMQGISEDSNAWQACVDENGYVIDDVELANSFNVAYYSREESPLSFILGEESALNINHRISFKGTSDPTDPSSEASYETVVDQNTGMWSGYARIFGDDFEGNRWVDFDWLCAEESPCYGENYDEYHVSTDLSTGEISGYAWNDTLGFISFNGLTQELRPRDIVTYVDVLAGQTDRGPDDVDYTTAPLADGYEYWRVRVQFFDVVTGQFLTRDDIDHLSISTNATDDSNVYLNQVENTGNAIRSSYENDFVGCEVDTEFCIITEADGSESFNRFVYSGAPTSNVLGENGTEDALIDYYSDRDACRWIYEDQWSELDGRASQPPCGFLAPIYLKSDYFYERRTDRNKYELESITIDLGLNLDREFEMTTYPDDWSEGDEGSAFVQVDDSAWSYYPGDGAADLSFRPRYQILKFTANYDGQDYTQISSDLSKVMYLTTEASVSETSSAYQDAGGIRRPDYEVYYQMDADTTDPVGGGAGNNSLLIDIDSPASPPDSEDFEETHREDAIGSSFASYLNYARDYAIGYGQKASLCEGLIACGEAYNVLTNPTAEQWVCDSATELRYDVKSCYYTDYLPHVDRYQASQNMLVIGAIDEVLNDEGVLSNEEQISVLGSVETSLIRNKIYSQVVRYTLGQEAASGSLDANMMPSSGILSLMNGRLLYAKGDVTVEGSDGFSDKTLVTVGGDVYINGDVEGGQLGVIALESEGLGGNVYVNPLITELHANLFLDGGLYSFSGTVSATGEPTWLNDAVRISILRNQLYLKGSLVSRNTVNGSSNEDGDFIYELGDGTTTSDFARVLEHDLNLLRQFRLCYPIDIITNLPDTTAEAERCEEGELLSDYGNENEIFNSFILDYSPPNKLPIFMMESGMRQ